MLLNAVVEFSLRNLWLSTFLAETDEVFFWGGLGTDQRHVNQKFP